MAGVDPVTQTNGAARLDGRLVAGHGEEIKSAGQEMHF